MWLWLNSIPHLQHGPVPSSSSVHTSCREGYSDFLISSGAAASRCLKSLVLHWTLNCAFPSSALNGCNSHYPPSKRSFHHSWAWLPECLVTATKDIKWKWHMNDDLINLLSFFFFLSLSPSLIRIYRTIFKTSQDAEPRFICRLTG